MTEHTSLRVAYESRLEPEYFVDEELNAVWQPDLYPEAATVARRLGARRIVDVGCGTAAKLAELHPESGVVATDFGSNIGACRARYPFGASVERDLDSRMDLGYEDVAGATLICGEVIEHLVHTERLLRMLRGVLAGCAGWSDVLCVSGSTHGTSSSTLRRQDALIGARGR